MSQAEEHVSVEESDYLRQNAQICDSRLLHAGLTDKNDDVRRLERKKMSVVVEQEDTTPRLNRIKTSQFKLEEKLEKH